MQRLFYYLFVFFLILVFLAITATSFVAYSSSVLCLIFGTLTLALTRGKGRSESPRLGTVFELFQPFLIAGVCLFLGHLIANLVNYLASSNLSIHEVFHASRHYFVKWVALPVVLSLLAFVSLKIFPWTKKNVGRLGVLVATWMLIYFMYCLAQRYFGIDWVHGYYARLPANRLAYGVYRISGIMSHPLSLAFNLVLLGYMSVYLAITYASGAWVFSFLATLATLLISGSRTAVFVLPLVLLLGFPKAAVKHWKPIGFLLLAAGCLLYIEGSFLNRLSEIFSSKEAGGLVGDRLIFWKAHFQAFLEKPLTGYGSWDVQNRVNQIFQEIGHQGPFYEAHNNLLQIIASSGCVGLVGFLAFLYFVARQSMTLALIVILCGLMQNTLFDSEFMFAFWLVGMILTLSSRGKRVL